MMNYEIGDVVITRKKHPCGGDRWIVTRIGADIKLHCQTCGHTVMLDYAVACRAIKKKEAKKEASD